MIELKRSIFVRYRDRSGFQFTRMEADRWMVHVTSTEGLRWLRGDFVDDDYVHAALSEPTVERVDQFD